MAIIDFEQACHYYRGFDLGMVIVGVCRDRKGISFEKAGQFIRGYQKQRTLQSIERETLKTFAVYAAVSTSFWHFRHHHLRRPEPRLYNKHVEMQTLADTISEYPDSSFTELCAEKTTAATSGELA
jgi:homoserine kinase type II